MSELKTRSFQTSKEQHQLDKVKSSIAKIIKNLEKVKLDNDNITKIQNNLKRDFGDEFIKRHENVIRKFIILSLQKKKLEERNNDWKDIKSSVRQPTKVDKLQKIRNVVNAHTKRVNKGLYLKQIQGSRQKPLRYKRQLIQPKKGGNVPGPTKSLLMDQNKAQTIVNLKKTDQQRQREQFERNRIKSVLSRKIVNKDQNKTYESLQHSLYMKYLKLWEVSQQGAVQQIDEDVPNTPDKDLYNSILRDINDPDNLQKSSSEDQTSFQDEDLINMLKSLFNTIQNRQNHAFRLKSSTQQAKLLSHDVLQTLKQVFVTEKTDGYHSLSILLRDDENKDHLFLFYKDNLVKMTEHPVVLTDTNNLLERVIIVEGEYIEEENTFHSFDYILGLYNKSIYDMRFKDRLFYLKDVLNTHFINRFPVSYKLKPFHLLNMNDHKEVLLSSFNEAWQTGKSMSDIRTSLGIDKKDFEGLVLYPDEKYSYSNTRIYKWKPLKHQTIDFMTKKTHTDLETGLHVYTLFSTVPSRQFNVDPEYKSLFTSTQLSGSSIPVKFNTWDNNDKENHNGEFKTDDDTLDGKVVELRLEKGTKGHYIPSDGEYPDWRLVRIRDDRQRLIEEGNYFGNFYKVASSIWEYYENPVLIEDILKDTDITFNMKSIKQNQVDRLGIKFTNEVMKKYIQKLIKKKRDEMSKMKKCPECDKQVKNDCYKTYIKTDKGFEKLCFCSIECFDKFEFE